MTVVGSVLPAVAFNMVLLLIYSYNPVFWVTGWFGCFPTGIAVKKTAMVAPLQHKSSDRMFE